jgi:hypothetical protein
MDVMKYSGYFETHQTRCGILVFNVNDALHCLKQVSVIHFRQYKNGKFGRTFPKMLNSAEPSNILRFYASRNIIVYFLPVM